MTILHADSLEWMRNAPDATFDAVVTDPPYALQFMGKGWDKVLPSVELWRECLRTMKPGAFLLAFGGTRTFHRLTCSIEDAGFEVRDCLAWLYGQGFPKSLDVSKAIDKAAGAEREDVGVRHRRSANAKYGGGRGTNLETRETLPSSRLAKLFDGYGTALKPAWEPIVVAMKPLDGTFAKNAERHGLAGMNVDGCRIPADDKQRFPVGDYGTRGTYGKNGERTDDPKPGGRWPANLVLDEEVAGRLGRASRFFYCAKASPADRGEGNDHPTVKPVELMRWLVRLVRPPSGGRILDPFCGSGTTGVACRREVVDFVGVDSDPHAVEIARRRFSAE